MSTFDILLPKMGESVAEATITRLLVQPGESVASDAPIVEIATDKVDSEVPAPEDGVLVEWLVAEGQTVLIIEAMKTMNHIPAPRAGTVKRILVSDGTAVEFGAPLMIIE